MPDIPANNTTTAQIFFEFDTGTFSGELNPMDDVDWIRIDLTAGATYHFYSHVQPPGGPGIWSNLSLIDAAGNTVTSDGNFVNYNPSLTYTPTASGTYYLAVFDTGFYYGGTYDILVTLRTAGDVVYPGGTTTINAGAGERSIAGVGRQVVTMGPTSLDALGQQGDDQITGNAQDNMISGGAGYDSLIGGDGRDLIYGDSGNDYLLGGAGDDYLRGGLGNDRLEGNGGSDDMDGGPGDDVLMGGPDSDRYHVDSVDDTIYEDPNGGTTDTVESTVTYTLPAEVEYLFLGAANINGTGNGLANIIVGNNSANVLDGKGGTDILQGQLGNDTYVLGADADTVADTGGTDTITSTISRSLASYAGIENLTLLGSSAINGTGSSGRNVIAGNAKANTLSGGGNNDTLLGGGGSDKLKGGAGRDTMTGGSGADDFIFAATSETGKTSATRDRITDFKHGSDDLDLHLIDANGTAGGNGKFTLLTKEGDSFNHVRGELRFDFQGSKTIVEGDTNGDGKADFQIELAGHVKLTAGDIIP